jgi:hypothetical protein
VNASIPGRMEKKQLWVVECAHLLSRGDANLAPIGRAPSLARGKEACTADRLHRPAFRLAG